MNPERIQKALECAEVGVGKYLDIMQRFPKVDVSADAAFQRLLNGYYKMGRRSPKYYACYFGFMESRKQSPPTFAETLAFIHQQTGRWEASFSSKLVATHDPTKLIWDKYVLRNTGLKAPFYTSSQRLERSVATYRAIEAWYEHFLPTPSADANVRQFDEHFGDLRLTRLKRVDFVLWQLRD